MQIVVQYPESRTPVRMLSEEGMTDDEFYGGADRANYSQHYAQARYLCYYLQEKGLLVQFYRQFVANARDDPTGYDTLKRVLRERDMLEFKKKWEKFVLGLRAP